MSAAASRRPVPSRKEATHDRIVATAARAIRRSGYNGMGVAEINLNQGAESTICFLLSLLEMLKLAGEELERDEVDLVVAESS